jgi:peptide/nickel transport system substrate-binding protein
VQAVLDMDEIMEAATDGAYKLNKGFQYPGQTYYTDAGKETYNQKNPAKAKQLLAQSGYKGEKVILLTNRDYPNMYTAATGDGEQMKSIGINAELLVLDWPATVNMYRSRTTAGTSSSPAGARSDRSAASAMRFFMAARGLQPEAGEPDKPSSRPPSQSAESSPTLDERKAAFAKRRRAPSRR